jgi:hypothetical protein
MNEPTLLIPTAWNFRNVLCRPPGEVGVDFVERPIHHGQPNVLFGCCGGQEVEKVWMLAKDICHQVCHAWLDVP